MEILPDIPPLHGAAGVPLVKPQLDLSTSVVLRPPALDVDGVEGEEILNARILLVQPHGKPLLDLTFPLFFCIHIHILLLHRLGSIPKHQIFRTLFCRDSEARSLVEAQGRVFLLDGEGCPPVSILLEQE